MPVDLTRADELYRRACVDLQLHRACRWHGDMLREGRGVAQDRRSALEFYVRACDGRDATGCVLAANMFHAGEGTAPDIARAVELARAACRLGDEGGCAAVQSAQAAPGPTR